MLLKRERSQGTTYGSKPLSQYQWLLMARLLQRGYSYKDAIEYMSRLRPSDQSLQSLREAIQQGKPIDQCLHSSRFEREMSFYVKYLPLEKSIILANEMSRKTDELKKLVISRLSYALILFLGASGLTGLFSIWVVPSMISSLEISESSDSLRIAFTMMSWGVIVLAMLVVTACVIFTIIRINRREVYLWAFLHKLKADSFIRLYVTYRFAEALSSMLDAGIGIQGAVNIIRHNRKSPLTALLAHHFEEDLLSGNSFESSLKNEFIDDDFFSLCLYGLRGDDFLQGLKDYLEITMDKVEKWITDFARIVQYGCYLFVMTVIVLGYQVILLPLDSLQLY